MTQKTHKKFVNRSVAQKLIITSTLVVMVIFFALMIPSFASYRNILTIALTPCVNGLLALGVTFAITSGGIDLSIGMTMTFSCVMSGISFVSWGFPVELSILFGFVVGGIIGLINGFAIAKMKLPPFIATLAMQMMLRGLSLVVSGIKPVYFTESPRYQEIALGNFLGIEGFYNAFALFVLIVGIAYMLYSKTLLGRYTQSIGSNEEAARLSGIPTDKWKILIYVVSGLFSAGAGLIISSRLGSAQPQLGVGYEAEAIAAAVIGGTSMSGGEGSIIGTIIGAFIISTLTNGLRSLAVSSELQPVVIGFVLAMAVYIDMLRRRKAAT